MKKYFGFRISIGFSDAHRAALLFVFCSLLAIASGCSTISNLDKLPGAIRTEGIGTVMQKDVETAIASGTAALGASDNLVVCYASLDATLKAFAASENPGNPDAYIFTDVMRVRIIQQLIQKNASLSAQACAPFYQEILLAIATRGLALRPNFTQIPVGPSPLPAAVLK